jgi:hypothetical protein
MTNPCGCCLNCRNGAPGLCLTKERAPVSAPYSAPPRIIARYCRCGEALYGKYHFCSRCRPVRNRETGRLRARRWSRQLTKNRASNP